MDSYEFTVNGHLHKRWAHLFDGMTFERLDNGTTILTGPIADQAALHGVLIRLRDLGLVLISVARIDTAAANIAHSHTIVNNREHAV